MQFGKVLRKMRKDAGMSQEDIALELHMSISNVSRLETDKYELKAADLVRWCNVTQAPEALIAFILGVDGLTIMHQVLEVITGTVATIFLGGIF